MFSKLFLRRNLKTLSLPEKNTFIHFDSSDSDSSPLPLRAESTCPDIIQKTAFRIREEEDDEKEKKQQRQAELHAKGECRPCAYFAFKKDGCRMGEDCEFCHLCDRSQVRRWQRLRTKTTHSDSLCVSEADSRIARCCGA
eukprot:TRINITY_DN977_c0_g1_i1.p2 TRINITY_DN977_c0_g1~~TRINITY_DN977_c0_g1_i1.p2  ORF type:complete len:140 (-),score=31.60 TRINITY_DN977_c0_g1_i1:534-953(-)